MDEQKTLEDTLAHFGIKGMRWGVRKNGLVEPSSSEDATRAKEAHEKVKIGGTRALSNQELQSLVTRLNLEQQYSRLAPMPAKKKAIKVVAEILFNVGKQHATKVATDIITAQVGKVLKK